MSYFEADPDFILETRDETLQAILHPELWNSDKWDTKSIWIYNLVKQMKAENRQDFVYNSDVWHKARELLGLPAATEQQNTPLSWMIYKAQQYVRSDALKADGYEPFTSELLERANLLRKKILCNGKECTPKMVNGKWYAFPPRSRTRVFAPDTYSPVKIV